MPGATSRVTRRRVIGPAVLALVLVLGTVGAYLVTAGAAGPLPARTAAAGPIIGINANVQGFVGSQGLIADRLRAGGVRHLREDLRWSTVQPGRGVWRWERYDTLFAAAARRGQTILPILLSTPSWAGPRPTHVPGDPRSYARFAARAVARYGPGGTFWRAHPELPARPAVWWELWNEPYYPGGSSNGIDAARYGRLAQAAAIAAGRANPRARFLVAVELDVRGDGRFVDWIRELWRSTPRLTSVVHGVAAHPYGTDLDGYDPADEQHHRQYRRILTMRRRLAEVGAGRLPMWITEMGFSVCRARGADCVSEARQAELLRGLLRRLRTREAGIVDALFVYGYYDARPGPARPEGRFGLIRRDFSERPAWRALVRALRDRAASR